MAHQINPRARQMFSEAGLADRINVEIDNVIYGPEVGDDALSLALGLGPLHFSPSSPDG